MKAMMIVLMSVFLSVSCVAGDPEKSATSIQSSTVSAPAATLKSPRPIGYAALSALIAAPDSRMLLLDVRTKEEFDAGHIAGSVLMPYDAIKATFAETDRNRPIVVYCRSGRRSEIAAETLAAMGFTDVSDFGAIDNWKGNLAR